jgi:hypothetical protein
MVLALVRVMLASKFYNKPIKGKRAITFEDAVLQTK